MNLTYEVKDNGYIIMNNETPWIIQTNDYIPYPAETVEESAQNHINQIIEDFNKPKENSIEEKIDKFVASQADQDELIMKLILGVI